MCTKRTLLGASKNRAWSLRPEKVDLAVPYPGSRDLGLLISLGWVKEPALMHTICSSELAAALGQP